LPNYDVQFGAFSELQRAQGVLAMLREKLRLPRSANTDRRLQIVRKAGEGDQVLFHVQFGVYAGRSAARSECDTFLARGAKCVIVRHGAAEGERLAVIDAPAGPVLAEEIPQASEAASEEASDEAFDVVPPRHSPTSTDTDAGELMLAMETRGKPGAQRETLPPVPLQKRILPNYEVQFGAFNELQRAQGLLAELQGKQRFIGHVDAGRRFQIVRKRNPANEVLFHVQFGAFLGWSAAQDACDGFLRRGQNCVVVRHRVAKGKDVNLLAASNGMANPL
jgi:hypothetical protein